MAALELFARKHPQASFELEPVLPNSVRALVSVIVRYMSALQHSWNFNTTGKTVTNACHSVCPYLWQ